MRLSELLAKAKIEYTGGDTEIRQIIFDSRKAAPGALFVCIRGFSGDGHAYADSAYAAGCRVFLAESPLSLPDDALVIHTESTRRALAQVSHAFYGFPAKKLRVIGITGTKGKTTTALMLTSILSQNGIPTGYIGTSGIDYAGCHYETQNTTPDSLTLAAVFADMLKNGMRAAVVEVSSQALYLDRVYGIPFFATAFTNLSPDHIGSTEHPTFEHYRDCKKKLFCDYPAEFSVFGCDDPNASYMAKDCKAGAVRTFGLSGGDYSAEKVLPFFADGAPGVRFTLRRGKECTPITLALPGDFNVQNALCAAALAGCFGVSVPRCANVLASVCTSGRFEVLDLPLAATFIVDYAHNGVSLENALRTLAACKPKKLWCVVGSVGGRTQIRRAEIGKAVSRWCDAAILTADNPDFEDPLAICKEIRAAFERDIPCKMFADRADALRYAAANAKAGEIVLLAGKGHERYQLICGIKKPVSERELLESFAAEVALV